MESIAGLSVTMLVLVTLVMAIGAALQAAVALGPALFVGPLLALLVLSRAKAPRRDESCSLQRRVNKVLVPLKMTLVDGARKSSIVASFIVLQTASSRAVMAKAQSERRTVRRSRHRGTLLRAGHWRIRARPVSLDRRWCSANIGPLKGALVSVQSFYWQVDTEQAGAALAAITPGEDGLVILGLPLMNGYFTVFDGEADGGKGVVAFAALKS
jgi:hypothetical protein